jgi:hypothetical protein
MIDQDRKYSPPGLVYMRAPHENWQEAIDALLRSAHSIILVLPPDEDLRDSFNWEVEQIVLHGLQARTIIVLPPYDRDADKYQQARERAAVLLATMETFAGTVTDADPLKVLHYEKSIRERTLVMKFDTVRHGYAENIAQWREADVPKRWSRRFRKRRVTASLYVMLVACALREVERELRGKPFAVRYPTRRVPTN